MSDKTYNEVKAEIQALKRFSTYDDLVKRYGINRYWLWHIINQPNGYTPPLSVRMKLGVITAAPIIVNIEVPPGTELPPNAVIIRCATCEKWFVRCHPRQKYCQPGCRKS